KRGGIFRIEVDLANLFSSVRVKHLTQVFMQISLRKFRLIRERKNRRPRIRENGVTRFTAVESVILFAEKETRVRDRNQACESFRHHSGMRTAVVGGNASGGLLE